MADIAKTTWLQRLRVRRISAWLSRRQKSRPDWRAALAASELPGAIVEIITRVVKRTRLSARERAEVATELIAHFRDGLSANETAEKLTSAFGNEKTAAKLIRRAKIRQRSIFWHIQNWIWRGVAVLLLVYFYLVAVFVFSKPAPTIDYLATLNAPALAVPESDRAWPLYRQAILALQLEPQQTDDPRTGPQAWLGENLDGKRWPEIEPWLRQHAADLETLRQATAKPAFGFLLGPGGSADDPALWPNPKTYFQDAPSGPTLLGVRLPYLNEVRLLAEFLQADAKLAQIDHDGPRVAADINAIISLADQFDCRYPFVVNDLVAAGVRGIGLMMIDRALTHDPQLLTDAQLIALAHRLSLITCGADLINLRTEEMTFDDIVQRTYSPNGVFGGRPTYEGQQFLLNLFASMMSLNNSNESPKISESFAIGPALMIMMGTRDQVMGEYDRIITLKEAQLRLPLRLIDRAVNDEPLLDAGGSLLARLRYGMLSIVVARLNRVQFSTEKYLGHRDGILIAIAMELYHRQHAAWPASLPELSPTFLPTVPVDRITGGPLAYRIKDGQPLIYSIGADHIDGGGVPGKGRYGVNYDAAAEWFSDHPPTGDWILFPRPELPEDE